MKQDDISVVCHRPTGFYLMRRIIRISRYFHHGLIRPLILLWFCLGSLTLSGEVDLTLGSGFESEYVFRGRTLAGSSLQPSIDFSTDPAYWGIWFNEPVKNIDRMAREIDLYAGVSSSWAQIFDSDLGFTFYSYPELSGSDSTMEIYAGTSLELAFQPAIYLYYDFDLKQWNAVFSGNYQIELDNVLKGLRFEPSWECGYTDAPGATDGYYATAYLDMAHEITDNATFSIGLRISATENAVNTGHDQHLWWGCRFISSF